MLGVCVLLFIMLLNFFCFICCYFVPTLTLTCSLICLSSMNRAFNIIFLCLAKRCIPSIYLSNSRNFSCLCMFYCICYMVFHYAPVLTFQQLKMIGSLGHIWMGSRERTKKSGINVECHAGIRLWAYKQIKSNEKHTKKNEGVTKTQPSNIKNEVWTRRRGARMTEEKKAAKILLNYFLKATIDLFPFIWAEFVV